MNTRARSLVWRCNIAYVQLIPFGLHEARVECGARYPDGACVRCMPAEATRHAIQDAGYQKHDERPKRTAELSSGISSFVAIDLCNFFDACIVTNVTYDYMQHPIRFCNRRATQLFRSQACVLNTHLEYRLSAGARLP